MSKSELEARFAYLLDLYGVGGWVREYRFAAPERKWPFDFCWVAERLAAEIDGGQWLARGGRHNTDADRWKMSEAAARGWKVLRFSGEMLDEPDRCMALVKRALEGGSDGQGE